MLKKVLIIENSVGYTGALKAALQEALLLSNTACFVFVIPSHSTNFDIIRGKGFTCYSLPLREINRSLLNLLLYLPALILNCFRLKKIIRREKCDIVQVNDFYNLLGVMLKLFGYKGKLVTYVRFLPSALPGLLRKIWVWTAQRYSYKVIAVSDAVLKQLPERENTVRIYDPVALPERYAKKIAIESPGETRFLYLANYTRGKGQELAIAAFAAAYRQQKNISLHFYGGDMGLQKNRNFLTELEKIVKRKGLNDAIHFNRFTEDVESVVKKHDVLLNFSESESFSMTCAEASYYGLPVIATRCGGPEEIIEDGITGYLVPKKDISEMSKKILFIAQNAVLSSAMGLAGANRIRTVFSNASFLKEMKKVFQ